MEFEEKEQLRKLDLFTLLETVLREAKRHFVLALVLMLVCAAGLTGYRYMSYSPSYTATASFTVKVANPLHAEVTTYNTKTAEQMAATFPYILTSGVLQERVRDELGIAAMPSVSVTANSSTSIITMKVTDSDPQRAHDVLNAVIVYYPEIAEYVVGPTVLVLLDESGVPTQPVNVFRFQGALKFGLVLGFVLWLILVAVMVLLRNTIHSEEELKRVLNTPCLGHIPNVKIPGKSVCPLITRHKKHAGFLESVRLLRLRVEKLLEQQGKNVLLISSAIPGEGKTTVSVNLALSLAREGRKVLLIDCDLRNPSVSKALQIPGRSSLGDYVSGKVTIRDLITSTEVENLYIISGGSGGKVNAAELLSQEKAAKLIQASRKLFDYVILDTPPCSLLADASEIAELADYGLMVIRQDFASRDQILDGVHRLGDANLPLVGCAINGIRKSLATGYGYGYGYGYGTGYGYGYGSKDNK